MTAVDDAPVGGLLRKPPALSPTGTRPAGRVTPPELTAPVRWPGAPSDHGGSQDRGRKPLTRALAWSLAAAIVVVIGIGLAIEPAPDGPEPIGPVWLDVLAVVAFVTPLFAIIALIAVQWSGVWLALLTGAGLFLLAVLCPVSGHHVPGPHIYAQLALFGGLAGASSYVLWRRRPPDGSAEYSRLVG